jgi:hypothetical protein
MLLNKQVHHGNNREEERSDSVTPYAIMASSLPHNQSAHCGVNVTALFLASCLILLVSRCKQSSRRVISLVPEVV